MSNHMARQQLKVLNAIDVARIQWYHFNVFLLTGLGLFTAAYDLFCISFVTKLLGRIYYQVEGAGRPGILPRNVSTAVLTAANCGTFFGQIIFGWLGDKLGRKKAYGITLILMVVFSLASGLSFGSSSKGVMATLCFFRFWLGFAVGGVYPLSATIMSEYANRRTRGKYIAAVFAMQGVGILVAGVVALIVASAFDQAFKAPSFFDDPIHSTVPQADCVWRIILMFGALPAAFTYFWRMKVPETARYTVLVDRDAKQAAADMSKLLHLDIEAEEEKVKKLAENPKGSFGLFSKEFLKCHGLHLFATSSTWFLLDIAYLSQNLLQTPILATVEWFPLGKRMNAIEEVNKNAKARIYITLCDTIPGLLFSLKYIDLLGRIWVQLIGFFFMTVFMFALAIPYHHWAENPSKAGFIILYSLIFFSANFGPSVTTFVLPAEIFPARLRSTCHGISAAAGKAGAIVGAFGFLYAAQPSDHRSVRNSLIILAFINLLGMSFACTFSFLKILPNRLPEPKRRPLEELTGENKEFGDEMEQQASSA